MQFLVLMDYNGGKEMLLYLLRGFFCRRREKHHSLTILKLCSDVLKQLVEYRVPDEQF